MSTSERFEPGDLLEVDDPVVLLFPTAQYTMLPATISPIGTLERGDLATVIGDDDWPVEHWTRVLSRVGVGWVGTACVRKVPT